MKVQKVVPLSLIYVVFTSGTLLNKSIPLDQNYIRLSFCLILPGNYFLGNKLN